MGTSVQRTSNVREIHQLGEAYSMPEKSRWYTRETVHDAVARAVKKSTRKSGPTEINASRKRTHQRPSKISYQRWKWLNTG